MAQSFISFFTDDAATTALSTRVPDAIVNSGVFGGGSNAPGLGISTENPGLDESLPSWTLLDQFGNARNGQRGQHIGGPGISSPGESDGDEGTLPAASIRVYDPASLPTYAEKLADPTLDGELTFPAENAVLVDLATGWQVGPPPP